MSSINKKYSHYLSTHPLLTKSVTAAVLATLNETIASLIAREFTKVPISFSIPTLRSKLNVQLLNPYNYKIPLLAVFALIVQGPFSHYAYQLLNNISIFKKKPLPLAKKLLQMAVSLLTITPIVCCLNAVFLGLINNKELVEDFAKGNLLQFFVELYGSPKSEKLRTVAYEKLQKIAEVAKLSLSNNLMNFLQSSWISSPLILFFAQNYLDPNSWVVFFNFAYFLLGTFQNTLLKLKLKQLRQKKKKEEEKEEEKKE
ncbi:hypothetical protein DASC09_053540 [Saccharomycopsis crataegensis]|uniref:Uncharacterized protein n=1 Tax=Saccharomycopsis crataegensis TaxID=43959 RepID=A0AAV5QTD6_9ASCO|nr:hypothetical protein DASC09_053540 [Saccharomycopsis crataegensis]